MGSEVSLNPSEVPPDQATIGDTNSSTAKSRGNKHNRQAKAKSWQTYSGACANCLYRLYKSLIGPAVTVIP